MPQAAARQDRMFATEAQQGSGRRRIIFCCSGLRPSSGEGVLRIAGPAAGEIAAIVRVVAAGHADFVAVVKLRDATQGERSAQRPARSLVGELPGALEKRVTS